MRPFEIALLIALGLRVAATLLPRGGRGGALRLLLAGGAGAALALHLGLEGWRWQLLPVYAFVVASMTRDLLIRTGTVQLDPTAATGRALRAGLGMAVALPFALPAALLPVPQLPAPTGPHPVGSDAFEFEVEAGFKMEEGGSRRVRARVWYPAAPGAAAYPRAPWLEHTGAMLPALAAGAGLPTWSVGHLRRTRTHARWGAPPLEGDALPVATFDHGRGGFAAQNTFLAEELASHGWLVVAPEHPGGALRTVFRDGTVVPFDGALFGAGLEGAAYDAAIRALGRAWRRETRAALDALAAGEGPAQLAGRLDRTRLAATGHSTGGGTAFGVCAAEAGCVAAIGLDPWLLPTPPELLRPFPTGGLRAPLLGLFSDPALGFFEPPNRAAFERLAAATAFAGPAAEGRTLAGAGHMDFADVTLLSPWGARLGLDVGPLPAREALPAVRRAVLAWLDALRR